MNGIPKLRVLRFGLDTHQEAVIYMRKDCEVCRSEGFQAQARLKVSHGERIIFATLNVALTELIPHGAAALSEAAWERLGVSEGDSIEISHPEPLASMRYVRAKIYGQELAPDAFSHIVTDTVTGRLSDIELSAFLAACAKSLSDDEVAFLTKAMVSVGEKLDWGRTPIVDKHCVGGLPGNRTTPLVVAIAAAGGLTIPKTSSRAITSPAGTADTMETLTDVSLTISDIRRVVEKEGGCLVWGGAVHLSPADDAFIRIERALDIDAVGQLVASVLSKKVAAGSTHVVLDLPVGPTAKVRDELAARELSRLLSVTARTMGLRASVILTDGNQPVGRGIGPALEAKDILAVLQNQPDAPIDLRFRAIRLAAELFSIAETIDLKEATDKARSLLDNGAAWNKFQAICREQGGLREPQTAPIQRPIFSQQRGTVLSMDNRKIAKVAKLAGAPDAKAAGLVLNTSLRASVERFEPLFTIHAETPGELNYALQYVEANPDMIQIGEPND